MAHAEEERRVSEQQAAGQAAGSPSSPPSSNPIVQELIEAGVHFGHRASRWNPKMRPYIYGKRDLIHIIDLRETVRGLLRACRFLAGTADGGSLVLFVGTKRQAREAVERAAKRCGMPF